MNTGAILHGLITTFCNELNLVMRTKTHETLSHVVPHYNKHINTFLRKIFD